MTLAQSDDAAAALTLVRDLQSFFAAQLASADDQGAFLPATWRRDDGRHGGGTRLTYAGGNTFNRASLNVSQVHYDDLPEKALGSATALSCIVHPSHPLAPSIHLHISWTEMKVGGGYWRLMVDLNPAIPLELDRVKFVESLQHVAGALYATGAHQGDLYFNIPALKRHRGVAHFYLEQYKSGDLPADRELASRFGRATIDAYLEVLALDRPRALPTAAESQLQLAYHTVYLFQVLTLDRGTTSGLLVHDQNDVGILGSLPARIDRDLLASWAANVPKPQDELVRAIVQAIPADGRIEDAQKIALCQILRKHYKAHPQALELQARGDVVPPTVQNHRA